MGKTPNPAQSTNPVNPDSDDFRKQVCAMIQSVNMFELRPYQETLLRQVQDELAAAPKPRIMLQLPTGGGKTVIAGALLAHWLQDSRKAVWLTHRKELAEQTQRMLTDAGVSAITNVNWRPGDDAPAWAGGAVILMAQTVGRRTARPTRHSRLSHRHSGLDPESRGGVWNRYGSNDLLVIDEAHHAAAPGWERAMKQWPGPIVGMTATPWRLSEKEGFDHLFDGLLCGPQTAELQALEKQALCDAQVFIPPPEQRIAGGAVDRTGDYTETGIERANRDRPDIMTAGALAFWQKHAADRPTIAYAVSVDHAKNLAAVFRDAGISADFILGENNQKKAERDAAISGFRDGSIMVLANVEVGTEGFDLPDASCVIIARPTMSLALYLQMVGRGLRPKCDGGDCLILDLAANSEMHGLPEDNRVWSLKPRGASGIGVAPIVWCPMEWCDVASPASSHYCRGCGYSFGKDCERCGRWRSYRSRWRYEKHCGDAHQLVCDLCHIDAHIQAHLPVAPPLDELVGLYSPEDEMTFPSDFEIDDDLANRLSALFRELLESERKSIAGADDARRNELRGLIEEREAVLRDDDELDRLFDEYVDDNGLPTPNSHAAWSRMYVDWEDDYRKAVDVWKSELAELENRQYDKQAIFGSVWNKVVHVLQREAAAVDLLPDRLDSDRWHSTLETSGSSDSSLSVQAPISQRSTVKESAIYWLGLIVAERDGQTVGLTYDEVLERVLEEHPSANTTRHGIAFYASHIRRGEKGYEHGTLPDIRPRTSWLQKGYSDISERSQYNQYDPDSENEIIGSRVFLILDDDTVHDAEVKDKERLLISAATEGDAELVRTLLSDGVNANARYEDEDTALHEAAFNDHTEVVQLLLAAGADPNARDESEYTALHIAAELGHTKVVQVLLIAGVGVNTEDRNKWTPLHSAAHEGHTEVVQLLLAAGADPNARDESECTALHRAYMVPNLVQVLLTAGADVNAEDGDKYTPLHYAASEGHTEVVQLLLDSGAEPNTENVEKLTPLHLANEQGHAEVVQVLIAAGADNAGDS